LCPRPPHSTLFPYTTLFRSGFAGDDRVVPFQIEGLDVRGRVVQFGPLLERILTRHDYPEKVSTLIGEAVVLAALLGSSLKLEGRDRKSTRLNSSHVKISYAV